MKYLLLFIVLLPALSRAQSNGAGLGKYRIGITTPDSLNRTQFNEEDPSYVKGTIALPCTHIRTFTSATVTIAGVSVADVVLYFYDDTLFKIACDYSDSLKMDFLSQYGPGVRKPVKSFQFCTDGTKKPLLMWGEIWPGAENLTFVVYTKGHTAGCKPEESTRLTIASQRMLALSSDCDLNPADLLVEEFVKAQISNQIKQR